jgi:hypothetical protein
MAMSAETRVVNLRSESFDVYIGRRSNRFATGDTGFWGNPFIIPYDGDRATVIAKHMAHIRGSEEHMRRLPELEGKRLGCFCKPLPCHGDNYVQLLRELRERQGFSGFGSHAEFSAWCAAGSPSDWGCVDESADTRMLREAVGATGDSQGQAEEVSYGTRGSTSADPQETPGGTAGPSGDDEERT